jgi:uncharacterized membrane protein YidH (DUF202 family)
MVDSRKIISIVTSVFVIFIVMKITEFLRTLPQCPCYAEKAGNKHNLDKIVFLQYSVIGIALIKIAHIVYQMFVDSSTTKPTSSPFMAFMLILTVSIYTFFTYNVYTHQQSTASQCECADKWQQNVMYFQALIYALVVALVLILGLTLLSSGSMGDGIFSRTVVLLATFILGLGIFTMFGGDMNVFLEKVMMEKFESMSPGHNSRSDPR